MLSLKNFELSLKLPERVLFSGLSVSLQRGECLALAGANGCGKSTLAEYLYCRIMNVSPQPAIAAKGALAVEKGINAVWLQQFQQELPKHIEKDNACYRRFLAKDLDGAGHPSDGQLQKLRIVAVLQQSADLYILDEPTNYLDYDGIIAVEETVRELKAAGKAVVLITHDRNLIDSVADTTAYFSANGVFVSSGGWAESFELYESAVEGRRRTAAAIGEKIKRLKKDAEDKKRWSEKCERTKFGSGPCDRGAIGAQAARLMKRSLQQRRRIEKKITELENTKPKTEQQAKLTFPEYRVDSKIVCELNGVGYAWQPERQLFDDLSLLVTTRDRLCLVGEKGTGKSTLLKLLCGAIRPGQGTLRQSESVRKFWLPQGLQGFWKNNASLLANFTDAGINEAQARRYLGAVGIWNEQAKKPLAGFSYGELMRAALVLCILSCAEFIFMDEPTSHLDVETIMVLEKMLQEFRGGFLLISHDQRFVENCAEKLLLIEGGKLKLL